LQFFSPHGQGYNGIVSKPKGTTNKTTNGTIKELKQKE
jgi:hypothetical protein